MNQCIIIFNESILEDMLMVLAENGVMNAIVLEGLHIQDSLANDFPIFSTLKFELGNKRKYCKVIFATIEEEDVITNDLPEALKEIDLDTRKSEFEILYFPVNNIRL